MRQYPVLLSGAVFLFMTGLAVGRQPAVQADTSPATDVPGARLQTTVEQASGRLAQWFSEHTGQWGRTTVAGVELWRYAAVLVLLFATFLAAHLVRRSLNRFVRRLAALTRWEADDLLLEAAGEPTSLFVTALGLYVACLPLLVLFSPRVRSFSGRISLAIAAGAAFWYFYRIVDILDHYLRKLARRTDNDLDDTFAEILRKTLRVFIVIVGVLFIGQSILQLKITALLASAGIAGLAVAFAAQDTIANFFGSFMLLLDRPFRIGERIMVADSDGIVEAIGFRSTRIRTLNGHLVSIPNKEVANAKVENIGRRPFIRRLSNFTITYDTPPEKVETAVRIIRDVLDRHGHMDPDHPPKVYFNDYTDWALNIIMIAWFVPADYWAYLEWCEQVNLDIMHRFTEAGIEFAFPTNTTYLAHDPNRALSVNVRSEPPPESRTDP
ncbi:MAG: mechanosensitive ion channel family protein [Kiritimatiellaeota bacterium]|nr:mechanosensitive ion channel family protein [Kiritimatiellota bacterium]